MDSADLYDEFGNYIGPELESEEEEEDEEEDDDRNRGKSIRDKEVNLITIPHLYLILSFF